MKTINAIFSKAKIKNVFLILGIIFITNQAFASNGAISIVPESDNSQKFVTCLKVNLSNEWKVIAERQDVSIYYTEEKGNACLGYTLKIVNHTNEKKEVSFAVAGQLKSECKILYADYKSFQFRTITLNPNETLIGSDKITALLLPSNDSHIPMEIFMQNINIQ